MNAAQNLLKPTGENPSGPNAATSGTVNAGGDSYLRVNNASKSRSCGTIPATRMYDIPRYNDMETALGSGEQPRIST